MRGEEGAMERREREQQREREGREQEPQSVFLLRQLSVISCEILIL
jgi:hypothetical protein